MRTAPTKPMTASNPALQAAFDKARNFDGANGYTISKRELDGILKAGAGRDGKYTREEARTVSGMLMGTYSNFTPAAAKASKDFTASHGFRDLGDVFTRG